MGGRAKKWRCFFCDEVFTNRRKAWLHFGDQNCESDVPACVDPLRTDEKERMNALRKADEYAQKCQRELEGKDEAEELNAQFYTELRQYFGADCNSVWLAADRYKSALNLIAALEEKLECHSTGN